MRLIDDLRAVVGDRHVLVDRDVVAGAAVDWTGRWQGPVVAVVRPSGAEEVAAVLGACATAGAPVVTQGGNTGLAGGSVPTRDAVVLSTARMDAVVDVDASTGQLTAGAGATLAAVQEAARRAGWRFGVDLGARAQATIGGMVATNAGGNQAARHGPMRHHVVGVEAVLPDGSVVSHLGGLLKDNTGYHLPSLLCGSEGTLAVVCAARLRLLPAHEEVVTAWVPFASVDEAVPAALRWFASEPAIEVLEIADRACLELAGAPEAGAGVLVEAVGPSATERLAAVLDGHDAEVAVTAAQREALWERRDGLPEAVRRLGVPVKADVAVPPTRVPELVQAVPGVVAEVAPGASSFCFGHLADGNVHVNVVAPGADAAAVEEAVLRLAVSLGGTISAEHGIGRDKVGLLHLVRSEAEISAFRAIKAALDPGGLLNPGVLLPA